MQHLRLWCFCLDIRTSCHGRPTNQTTGRVTRTVFNSEAWTTMKLGNSMMISAPPPKNTSAKKVWHAIFFIHRPLVLYFVLVILCLVPPQPRDKVLLPSPQHLDQVYFKTRCQALECPYLNTCMCQLLYLSQAGMISVVLGQLTLSTTTATCLTTCQWGRGQRLALTASTRVETSSVSQIPLNRRSFKVRRVIREDTFCLVLSWLSSREFISCSFLQGVIQQSPTGISLWMGGHDSITEGGWEWTDGSPFRYIHWNAG